MTNCSILLRTVPVTTPKVPCGSLPQSWANPDGWWGDPECPCWSWKLSVMEESAKETPGGRTLALPAVSVVSFFFRCQVGVLVPL